MRDVEEHGRRPFLREDREVTDPVPAEAGLDVCPGAELGHDVNPGRGDELSSAARLWGPVRGVYVGFSNDDEIRHVGSSGGVVSALALYCVEAGEFAGVLQTRADREKPWLNESVLSRSREEVLGAAASRYSPASPCERLDLVENASGECVFVGKPCDVAAARRAASVVPELARRLGLTIGFFCAGVPSTRGTVDLLRQMGVEDLDSIRALRYRGHGWPGHWTVHWETESREREAAISYEESWGFLQAYRQWRCRICPDHTGEFADIAVGDPWHTPPKDGEPGRSLVVARTARGQSVLDAAVAAGYLTLTPCEPDVMDKSQPNLVRGRTALWGRLLGLRLLCCPAPRYRGFRLFRNWLLGGGLPSRFRSVVGTMKRAWQRRLFRKLRT
jgi:coenzyme F420 hydrogenase subunit beta